MMKTLVLVFLLVASPVAAQVPGGDFHAWFLSQVAEKPFGQQTLLNLSNALNCVGSQLTPANHDGEKTKIWDPIAQRWTRVGFGEGHWVWYPHDDERVPLPPLPCLSEPAPNPEPSPAPVPVLIIDYAKIAALVKADGDVTRKDLSTHDDKQNQILAFLTNAKTIVAEVGVIVGWALEHYVINPKQ